RVARQILAESLLDTAAGFLAKHGSVPPAGIRAPPACQRCWQHGPTNAAGGGAFLGPGGTRPRRAAPPPPSWSGAPSRRPPRAALLPHGTEPTRPPHLLA